MTQTPNSANKFAEFEARSWQKTAPQYHTYFGALTQHAINTLLDEVKAKSGRKILDVATGPGYLAARAQERRCEVIGLDFAAAMLKLAKTLNPTLEFVRGSADNLPFNDAEFDTVASNFGFPHFANPEKAVREAFRVIRPGGILGFTVWQNLARSQGFKLIREAIQKYGDFSVRLPQGSQLFYYSNANDRIKQNCFAVLTQVGFINANVREIQFNWQVTNADELFDTFLKGSARTGEFLRRQSEESIEKIREEIRQSATNYKQNNRLVFPMAAFIASAEKP